MAARWAHNPKVVSSNLASATIRKPTFISRVGFLVYNSFQYKSMFAKKKNAEILVIYQIISLYFSFVNE